MVRQSFWIALEIALRFLCLIAIVAAVRHAVFPGGGDGLLQDLNSPIGPLEIDPQDTRPAVVIFLRNVSVMLFFALLVSLDYVRRTNRKLNPTIGAPRDRTWKIAVYGVFTAFVIWMILRLTSAYIDLTTSSGLPIWKLFISTLPYGAVGLCGVCMPIGIWMASPRRSFTKTFRPLLWRGAQIGALLIAAAAVLESEYRPDLIDIWFQI